MGRHCNLSLQGTERRYVMMCTTNKDEFEKWKKFEVGFCDDSACEQMQAAMEEECDTYYGYLVTQVDAMIAHGRYKDQWVLFDFNKSHITVFRGRRYEKGSIPESIIAHEHFLPAQKTGKEFDYVVEVLHPAGDDHRPVAIMHGGGDYDEITIIHHMSPLPAGS